MRQSHQKSRSRGRGRKPQNPLGRNYESNGPDVKIRGNAAHIAEKYSSLARDAQSNGDTVMAENYLQHAEHYNRIVAAAQAQKAEENQLNARTPQPDGDGNYREAPAEQQAENLQADTDSPEVTQEAGDVSDGPRRQKSGRGRRVKSANGVNGTDHDEVQSQANEAPDMGVGEVEAEASAIEVVSEDAAKLPESIIGEMAAEET